MLVYIIVVVLSRQEKANRHNNRKFENWVLFLKLLILIVRTNDTFKVECTEKCFILLPL